MHNTFDSGPFVATTKGFSFPGQFPSKSTLPGGRIVLALALMVVLISIGCAPVGILTPDSASGGGTAQPTEAPRTPSTVPPRGTEVQSTATAFTLTISDVAGRRVTITGVPQRIISLAPSNTEILFSLDLGPRVVAVDELSDYPAEAKPLRSIGGSMGNFDFEKIVVHHPDLVLAVGSTPPAVIQKLDDLKMTVVVLGKERSTFESIFSDIALVGQVTGRVEQAGRVIDAMKQKLASIEARVATAQTKPRVYWELDGTDPAKPFTTGAGTFVDDVIMLGGGTNIFAHAASIYPQVSSEQIVAANPEVIILTDAAYGISVDSVLKRPGWQNIVAVQKREVFPIDDNLVSRPGPRVVDGLEAVARLIHPEVFR